MCMIKLIRQFNRILINHYLIFNKDMKLANYVDPVRCWQLLSGVLGIYISYLVTGIIHEAMYLLFKSGSNPNTRTTTLERRRTLPGHLDSWCSLAGQPGSSEPSSTTSKSNLKIEFIFPLKSQLSAQSQSPSRLSPIHMLSTWPTSL